MEKNYIQINDKEDVMVRGPKKETIEFLLSYSKAMRVLKDSENEEFEMILN